MKRNMLTTVLAAAGILILAAGGVRAQNGAADAGAGVSPPGPADAQRMGEPSRSVGPGAATSSSPAASAVPESQPSMAPAGPPDTRVVPALVPAETAENDAARWIPWIIGALVLIALAVAAYLTTNRRGQVIAATKGGATGSRVERTDETVDRRTS